MQLHVQDRQTGDCQINNSLTLFGLWRPLEGFPEYHKNRSTDFH